MLGLLASALWDVPTGAAVVCALTLAAPFALILRYCLTSRPSII